MPNWQTDTNTGLRWLEPDVRLPSGVRAASTGRAGGVSQPPYDGLNLGTHVGDRPQRVAQNRACLRQVLDLPDEPAWLNQVHRCEVVGNIESGAPMQDADAIWTDQPGQVCAVMTADCLPLLLWDRGGREVAAVHAGWRGLCEGVIEAAVRRFSLPPDALCAWLGPAIGPQAFEVGNEVREAFEARNPVSRKAFRPLPGGKWLADIFLLARQRLEASGVTAVSGGELCTYADSAGFFSYRRDGVTGRMATLIWLE
jgi:YfiH family protein